MSTDLISRLVLLEREVEDMRESLYGNPQRGRIGLTSENDRLRTELASLKVILWANVAVTSLSILLLILQIVGRI